MVEDVSWRHSELSGSVREYMIYFTGMGDGESRDVGLGDLLEELPYRDSDVMDDLERLEELGYLESSDSGIYPVETQGFDKKLEDTVFDPVDESFYRLDDRGFEFVQEAGLNDYEESLRSIFR